MVEANYTLGIDTSCDETSAAVLKDGRFVLSNIVSSQVKIHQSYGGVVPELASRAHLENLKTVIDCALKQAQISLKNISGIAVTTSPGLIGCLLVGLSYAKSMAYALNIPVTGVHHLKGHLFSGFLELPEVFPFLGLVVSGGHTALYQVKNFEQIECLGQTVDDAAGEAFDKVAKLMGLGYPGGPVIDVLSREGNSEAFKFTRAQVKKGPFYFSFSGLKTAVSRIMNKQPLTSNQQQADLAASFQKEVVSYLVQQVERGAKQFSPRLIMVTGGVAVNSLLRKEILKLSEQIGIRCHFPSPILCTDNGAMIAFVGYKQILKGNFLPLDGNAYASTPLTP